MEIHPGEITVFIVIFLFILIGGFLLLLQKGKLLSNRLLGAFFLFQGLSIIEGYLLYKGYYSRQPGYAFWFNNSPWLYGPLLFGYTLSIIYKDFRLRWRHLRHLLFFGLFFLLFVATYHLQPLSTKLEFLRRAVTDDGWYVYAGMGIAYAHILTYVAVSFKAIRRYRQTIRERYSDASHSNLNWLEFTLAAFTLTIFINLFYNLYRINLQQINPLPLFILTFCTLLFIAGVLLKALQESRIFAGIPIGEVREQQKYAYSSLTDSGRRQHLDALRRLMEEEKPHLEPSLSLEELAERLKITAKTLSQVINESLDQHFFDFVNQYRIEEAKRLLCQDNHPKATILEVMYAAGFNSKSSFNTAFKKHAGMTPSQFRKGC